MTTELGSNLQRFIDWLEPSVLKEPTPSEYQQMLKDVYDSWIVAVYWLPGTVYENDASESNTVFTMDELWAYNPDPLRIYLPEMLLDRTPLAAMFQAAPHAFLGDNAQVYLSKGMPRDPVLDCAAEGVSLVGHNMRTGKLRNFSAALKRDDHMACGAPLRWMEDYSRNASKRTYDAYSACVQNYANNVRDRGFFDRLGDGLGVTEGPDFNCIIPSMQYQSTQKRVPRPKTKYANPK
jgi:hypothetical protein